MEKRRILEWKLNFIFDFIFFCAVCTFIICMLYFWSFFELRGTHLSGVELIILLCSWHIIIWPHLFVVLFMHICNTYIFIHFYSHIHILSPLPPHKSSLYCVSHTSFCLYITLQNTYCFWCIILNLYKLYGYISFRRLYYLLGIMFLRTSVLLCDTSDLLLLCAAYKSRWTLSWFTCLPEDTWVASTSDNAINFLVQVPLLTT